MFSEDECSKKYQTEVTEMKKIILGVLLLASLQEVSPRRSMNNELPDKDIFGRRANYTKIGGI